MERQPLSAQRPRGDYAPQIARDNNCAAVPKDIVTQILDLLVQNIDLLSGCLQSVPGNYRCLFSFRQCAQGIEMRKTGDRVRATPVAIDDADVNDFDLVYTTRAHYLRNSLVTKCGHEILWVRSGGKFRYARRNNVSKNIHREMIAIARNYESERVPTRCASGPLYGTRQLVKRLLRKQEVDLYDLDAWTVYDDRS